MTGDPGARHGRRTRRRWRPSIRTRVLAIVFIPSAALLITCAVVAGFLISDGVSQRNLSTFFQRNVAGTLQATSTFEQERTVSLLALGGDPQARAGLQAQWTKTNAMLATSTKVTNAAQGVSSQAAQRSAEIRQLSSQLAVVRQGVQTGRASASKVDAFYTQVLSGGSGAYLLSALSAPDVASAVDQITAMDLLPIVDLHSRVAGLGGGWATHGALSQSERVTLAQLTGAYQNQLQVLAGRLPQVEQSDYSRLVAGGPWRLATSGEANLAQHGKLGVPLSSWLTAENAVSADLFSLWVNDYAYSEATAVNAANNSLFRSVLAGSLVLVLAIGAFVAAILLANGLVRRLRRLRSNTIELADVRLPSMIRRTADGEPVGVESEMALLDYGNDEIGQVAEAFNTAQRTAVTAAVTEAKTRIGISKVFLDIAHRSQLVVHRQLELLDVAEAKQSDPEHLELLFKLDHLATRARRNAENLLILGGGQPGRRWRQSAGLEDIVRSAVSETEQFARVSTVRLPHVHVQGTVVGDLVHLLAELVDNATAFSPPDAAVTVRGNMVGKGVVIEVEDQGLGIDFAEREQINETLRNPPDFQAMAVSGQRHLGLFVVGQLAARHGIAVSLVESAYGGIKAIVLVPSDIVEVDSTGGVDSPAAGHSGRREQPKEVPAGVAAGPAPRHSRWENTGPWEHPTAEPPAEPASPSTAWPDMQAPRVSSAPRDMGLGTPPSRAQAPAGRSRAPLPRRVRLANLAPGLQPESEAADSPRVRTQRSPEEARGSMSAFQRGTHLARHTDGEGKR